MPHPRQQANTPAARALREAGLTIADAQDGVYTRLRRLDDVPDWRYWKAPNPGGYHRALNILTGKVRPEHYEGGALADVLQTLAWGLWPDAYASPVPVTRTAPTLEHVLLPCYAADITTRAAPGPPASARRPSWSGSRPVGSTVGSQTSGCSPSIRRTGVLPVNTCIGPCEHGAP